MKTMHLTRAAAAVAALAVAAPALPCGLMQHEAAGATPSPAVAETPRTDVQAQPQKAEKTAKKAVKQAKKTTTVAKS
jgi:hypothetical protein